MEEPKFGDVRGDGFVFQGYQTLNGKKYEHWLSPESVAKKKARIAAWHIQKREKTKADPVALAESRRRSAEHMHKSRRERPEKEMLRRVKNRAKTCGLEFSIDLSHFSIPDRCPVLGIPLFVSDGFASDNSPELDRINNAMGYVPGNVIVVSRRANRIKNDSTLDELRAILDFYSSITRPEPAQMPLS